MKIATKAPKVGKDCEVEYDVGATLADSVELYGEPIVHGAFVEQLVVKVQAGCRRCLEEGKDPVAWAAAYKPGVKAPSIAKDPLAAATAAISQMSDEQKKDLIAQLSVT